MTKAAIVFLLLLLTAYSGFSRSIRENFGSVPHDASVTEVSVRTTTVTCEPSYGFLPCTTELWGQLFLIIVYEYLLSLAAKYVSSGSDLFFKMFGTGIFGASLFHILGTIPSVAILLVTGLTGSTDTAEGLTAMGLAMLAGSAVMSLTLIWGAIVAFGSYDISKTQPTSTSEVSTPLLSDTTNKKSHFSLTGFGVTTDSDTTWTARILLVSMLPFIILQLPQILNSSTAIRIAILIALIIALLFLIAYCTYQVFQPWIQNRRLEYILLKFVEDKLLQSLLDSNGKPHKPNIKRLFEEIDKDNDANISTGELEALFLGIKLKENGLNSVDYGAKIMKYFDTSGNALISESEFVKGLSDWLEEANSPVFDQPHRTSEEEKQSLVRKRKQSNGTEKSWLNHFKAAFLLGVGTAISALLAQPLLEAIQDFASDANIPSFIISYIIIPLAMSYRSTISAITSSRQKTERAISLTFSAIYGGVFMNNMISLTVFLLIVYVRDLTWDVSAGVLVVLIVGLVMGIFTSFSSKFPLWTCIPAFLLYPISLVLIYVLTIYLGWS